MTLTSSMHCQRIGKYNPNEMKKKKKLKEFGIKVGEREHTLQRDVCTEYSQGDIKSSGEADVPTSGWRRTIVR